ncbi:hypothetical protein F2Q69_00031885 [Brassica cretica]|uniref:Phospholipid/glycerol acyltransferase domain-containing protein n=1 Tax=Brassica cretica TaxID=69181 RepID=A0A8S9S529_BRACR|nr:hypothetical protein F2Q69_00031885 [Brassica cretica]
MVMETSKATSPYSVVSEFEGTLLKRDDPFSYFMLLSFDASGVIRFALLLFLCPVTALLNVFSYKNAALKLMIFVATAGLRESEIELVARDVLPKFYMDDLSMDTWIFFQLVQEKDRGDEDASTHGREKPHLGLGRRPASIKFISLCEEQIHEPVQGDQQVEVQPPKPVIFHDGGLMKRPTPANALIILLWFPFGIILSVRSFSQCGSYLMSFCRVTVKGKPPPKAGNSRGVLFVCNHRRTMIDPLVISYALGRSIPAVLISEVSRFYDILSPVPIVWFTRNRDVDAVVMMEKELSKGDLVVCPEGSICYQPFVLTTKV